MERMYPVKGSLQQRKIEDARENTSRVRVTGCSAERFFFSFSVIYLNIWLTLGESFKTSTRLLKTPRSIELRLTVVQYRSLDFNSFYRRKKKQRMLADFNNKWSTIYF